MNIENFLTELKQSPRNIQFAQVIALIDENYDFTPTAFDNGETRNEAGQNNGSCKLFFFANLWDLTVEETLNLFGDIYHVEVLGHPEKQDHANIRNFMKFGWDGIAYEGVVLRPKS